jgi:hypothetical protein
MSGAWQGRAASYYASGLVLFAVPPSSHPRSGLICVIPQLMPLVNSKPGSELLSDLDGTVAWAKAAGGSASSASAAAAARSGNTPRIRARSRPARAGLGSSARPGWPDPLMSRKTRRGAARLPCRLPAERKEAAEDRWNQMQAWFRKYKAGLIATAFECGARRQRRAFDPSVGLSEAVAFAMPLTLLDLPERPHRSGQQQNHHGQKQPCQIRGGESRQHDLILSNRRTNAVWRWMTKP